jgi:Fe-S oxidoreductase
MVSRVTGTATRDTFAGLGDLEVALWYLLIAISTAIFAVGCVRLVRRWRSGRVAGARVHAGRALVVIVTHAWIGRRAGFTGVAHAAVFYGFMVLFAGTGILAFQDDLAEPLFGWVFWRGAFYQGYSLFLDVFGAALLLGLGFFAVRRLVGVARLDYARDDGRALTPKRARYRLDDWVFLWSLVYLGATGFLLEALRIAIDRPSFEVWSPVGLVVGDGLRSVGLDGDLAASVHHVVWWGHGVVALAFVAALPFTKAMHMLTGPANVALRVETVSRRLPDEPETGYATLADFDRRHLLGLDACTKCGKCHEVCPAHEGGMPLSPRDLILDLREASADGVSVGLVGGVLHEATLWSCMQCNACVEICPVGIEHVPVINLLRRGLVEHGRVDDQLQGVLEAVATTGNSFGESRRKRARWARDLEPALKDARAEACEVLWYVGDYASFDPRNQRNTLALAGLLQTAGVDVGILFDGERTAGNDVRRAGEEGLFRSLAEDNIATIAGCTFDRILTSDPHTFNTLRNEYPGLGAPWRPEQVVHHTVLLGELLDDGALQVSSPLGVRATYHDPCTLGRYNGIYEQPRELLRRCGVEVVEMPRNRSNSFCCGAGGGRIWMRETAAPGSRRPAEQRIDEAVALDAPAWFVVACPKDVTMYADAIKTSGHESRIELREVSGIVAEAVGG